MKRGQSGLSLVVGVNKPTGMSSHDVVNRCRKVFGERRVGHTGTLDPLASGVLPICVGPATRLDAYMTGHDKRYRVTVVFGCETTTDDAEGEPTVRIAALDHLRDERFASFYVESLVGEHDQVPPQYSAVKVDGKKSYEVARKGGEVALESRRIEVYDAKLVRVSDGDPLSWVVDFHVSKGTYIRSLARDTGRNLSCAAHVGALQRLSAGRISLDECVSIDTLESLGAQAALDPVRMLGYRFAFADDYEKFVNSGVALYANQLKLYAALPAREDETCGCTSGICLSGENPIDGEIASVLVANKLKALYRYDARDEKWKSSCVFSTPIIRG